jgi:hypothetical protein
MLAATIEISGLGAVAVGVSTPFPGTALRDQAKRLGAIIGRDRWSNYTLSRPVYSTEAVSADDLRKALYLFHTDKRIVAKGGFLVKDGPPREDTIRFRQRIEQWVTRLSELNTAHGSSPRPPGDADGGGRAAGPCSESHLRYLAVSET